MQTNVPQFTLLTSCITDVGDYACSFLNDISGTRSETITNMNRYRNMDRDGNNWSEAMIKALWEKGNEIPGIDPNKYRKDSCGAWMQFNKFGYIYENGAGWEIDHIHPVSQGSTDDIQNLKPLQWQNNCSKSNEFPVSDFVVIGLY